MLPGKNKRSKRPLRFETLSDRVVLSANSLLFAEGGEGENHETMVLKQGEVAFVFGTDDDNKIDVVMGAETHLLTIDGEKHEFHAKEVRHIVISGQGGNDEANVDGSSVNDRVKIDNEEIEMLSSDYGVRIRNVEVIRVFGNQGFDTAQIRDSHGDDEVFMHSTFTGYKNGAGDIMKVSGFERVDAFAERGGYDRVSFYDSRQNDRFVAKQEFSYLVGDGFSNYAKGFNRVDAYYRIGGADQARLFGSDGNDSLYSTPTQVVFQVGNTKQVTHNFPVTRAYGKAGSDIAEFHGQAGLRDVFGWKPGSAFMTTIGEATPNADSNGAPVKAANAAEGFERVEGFGSDQADQAKISGSTGDDIYIALPEIVKLTTPHDGTVEANNFGMVSALGGGGNDFAHLEDSPENDRYTGKEDFAFFKGPGFVNYISGFSKIDAISSNGGGDYSRAFDYRGPDRDYLVHDSLQFLVFGPERSERFVEFEVARGDGNHAGWNIVSPIVNPFTLGGFHDNSQAGVPNPADTQAILDRLDEVVAKYEVVNGDLVRTDTA